MKERRKIEEERKEGRQKIEGREGKGCGKEGGRMEKGRVKERRVKDEERNRWVNEGGCMMEERKKGGG